MTTDEDAERMAQHLYDQVTLPVDIDESDADAPDAPDAPADKVADGRGASVPNSA